MLHHLHRYGLTDLSFLIVNSKQTRSQLMINELENRVSFPVLQETDDEEVWSVMEGGKDDMYIYDRCGRLAFFIPFPLSIIHSEQPVVLNAIISAYFQEPCGANCSQNGTVDVDSLEERIIDVDTNDVRLVDASDDFENSTTMPDDISTVQNFTTIYDDLYNISQPNMSNITNGDVWNETLTVVEMNVYNSSHGENKTTETKNFLSSILNFFTKTMSPSEVFSTNNETTETHHHQENDGLKDKKIRCLGAEPNVCKDWSKRRLINARKCCQSIDADDKQDRKSCRNFGKKRCKKIQTVLKCCLRTELQDIEDWSSEENPSNLESQDTM